MRKNISVIASSLILFPKLQNEEVNNNVTVNTATISTKNLANISIEMARHITWDATQIF